MLMTEYRYNQWR